MSRSRARAGASSPRSGKSPTADPAADSGAKGQRQKIRDVFVARPFEGLADEVEWVALRELIPAATAPLTLAAPYADRDVLVATVLPLAWPAMVRSDGQILLGLQTQFHSGDISRDLGAALRSALDTEPGTPVAVPALASEGPRLQDLLTPEPLVVTLRDSFSFWLADDADDDEAVAASVEQANEGIHPTEKLATTAGAYWCQMGDKAFVRWVLADEEDSALDALARLGAAGSVTLTEETRLAGMFRAHGLLIPVWEVPFGVDSGSWEEPLSALVKRYADAVTTDEPLSSGERRAKQGLIARQMTLR